MTAKDTTSGANTFAIVRTFAAGHRMLVIQDRLTRAEAQAGCQDSRTADDMDSYTLRYGPWHDTFVDQSSSNRDAK